MDPTEGYGLDLIFSAGYGRRYHRDGRFSTMILITMWCGRIQARIISECTPRGRRMVGLEDVSKDGIEMEIGSNITEDLSANLSFAYVDWKLHNGPKGGIEEMSAADVAIPGQIPDQRRCDL
ncbi:MAG: hypothetical protein R2860_05600 [Desulfobacterales bacterium]